jgi:hypothetical protein
MIRAIKKLKKRQKKYSGGAVEAADVKLSKKTESFPFFPLG